ncbi:MAG: hypothetical protein ACOCRK_08675 [bacterium]
MLKISIIIYISSLIIGFIISIFLFTHIIYRFLFDFPFLGFLNKIGAIENKYRIVRKYIIKILLASAVITVAVILAKIHINNGSILGGLLAGTIFAILNLLRPSGWGVNPKNVRHFVSSNKKYFKNKSFAESILSNELKEKWQEKKDRSKQPLTEAIKSLHEKYSQQ